MHATAGIRLEDGTLALVSNARHDVRTELHGTDGSIAAGLDDKLPLRSVEPGVEFPAGKPYVFFMDRFAAAFRAELSAFVEVAAGTRPSPCTIDDALETGWVAEAATPSLASTGPSASTR